MVKFHGMPGVKRIKITSRCNQRCLFCDSRTGAGPGRAAILREIAGRNGAQQLNITGGEPTLCRELPAYIRAARRAGYDRIRLLTNGLKLADAAYCRQLRRAGLDEAMVAFQHADAAAADLVCSAKGAQALRLRALKNIKASGIQLTANILIFSLNAPVLPDIVLYLYKEFGVNPVMFSFLEPNCDSVRARPWLAPPVGPALASLKRALEVCRKNGIGWLLPYHGALPACVYATAGIKLPRKEIAQGSDLGEGRIKGAFCAACRENGTCLGFLREYYGECLALLRTKRGRTAS